MQQGIGWLRWTPETFWNATLAELYAGLAGLLEFEKDVEPRSAKSDMYDSLLDMALEAQRAEREGRA